MILDAEKELKSNIQTALDAPLRAGQQWYLLEVTWFMQLKQWLNLDGFDFGRMPEAGEMIADELFSSSRPGSIDNGPLLDSKNHSLKRDLVERVHFVFIESAGWLRLVDEFSVVDESHSIARPTVVQKTTCTSSGMPSERISIEVYKLPMHIIRFTDLVDRPKKAVNRLEVSRATTIGTLTSLAAAEVNLPSTATARLRRLTLPTMNLNSMDSIPAIPTSKLVSLLSATTSHDAMPDDDSDGSDSVILDNLSEVVADCYFLPQDLIIVEILLSAEAQWESLVWLKTAETKMTNGGGTDVSPPNTMLVRASPRLNSGQCRVRRPPRGLVGLNNLGNTCFMNSIIQCLSNCPPIMEYFANNNHLEDINEDNPLGMQGQIGRAFGDLIKQMWTANTTTVMPKRFKMVVGRFAPQFSGYQQQDSQELLTFLLDGLHEDLNRVKKKPYIEMKDPDGRSDEDVATETWSVYKKRNDSVILDLFHGLLKSTVVCPECDKVSIKFDPFCHLSLPLPDKKTTFHILFHPLPGRRGVLPSQWLRHTLYMAEQGNCVQDLLLLLAEDIDRARETSGQAKTEYQLVACQVMNGLFKRIYKPTDSLSSVENMDDVHVYEVPASSRLDNADTSMDYHLLYVYFNDRPASGRVTSSTGLYSASTFARPLIIPVARRHMQEDGPNLVSYNDLYSTIHDHLVGVGLLFADDVRPKIGDNGHIVKGLVESGDAKVALVAQWNELVDKATSNGEAERCGRGRSANDAGSESVGKAKSNGDAKNGDMDKNEEAAEAVESIEDDGATDKYLIEQNKGLPKIFAVYSVHRHLYVHHANVRVPSSYNSVDAEAAEMTRKMLISNADGSNLIDLTDISFVSTVWTSVAKRLFVQPSPRRLEELVDAKSSNTSTNGVTGNKRYHSGQDANVRLEDCLALYTARERLGEQDTWYCPRCKKDQRALKKFDLWTLPSILVVSLKRFSYTRLWRNKLDTLVTFPVKGLQLDPYIINPGRTRQGEASLYDLVAVSNHYGSMGGGHYTAYAKNKDDCEWYCFDDSDVSSIGSERVVTKAAYVLLYMRRADSTIQ